jgi:hypothetical protein
MSVELRRKELKNQILHEPHHVSTSNLQFLSQREGRLYPLVSYGAEERQTRYDG